jgi:hypothetical protein
MQHCYSAISSTTNSRVLAQDRTRAAAVKIRLSNDTALKAKINVIFFKSYILLHIEQLTLFRLLADYSDMHTTHCIL